MDKKTKAELDEILYGAKARYREVYVDALSGFLMEYFGDYLAKKQKKSLRGKDAIVYALVKKYGWSPNEIHQLGDDDIQTALHDEYKAWPDRVATVKLFHEQLKDDASKFKLSSNKKKSKSRNTRAKKTKRQAGK